MGGGHFPKNAPVNNKPCWVYYERELVSQSGFLNSYKTIRHKPDCGGYTLFLSSAILTRWIRPNRLGYTLRIPPKWSMDCGYPLLATKFFQRTESWSGQKDSFHVA